MFQPLKGSCTDTLQTQPSRGGEGEGGQDVLPGTSLLLRLPVCMHQRVREVDDRLAPGWQGGATWGHCGASWSGGIWPWTAGEPPLQVVLRRL